MKQEPITTLWPIDKVSVGSARPIRQQIAIIGGLAFGLALAISLL